MSLDIRNPFYQEDPDNWRPSFPKDGQATAQEAFESCVIGVLDIGTEDQLLDAAYAILEHLRTKRKERS